YTTDLYSWRKSFEHFNICHKWNTKDNQDNDLFMVLGKVEASWISPEEIDNLCHQLRAFLSREMAIIPLTQKQLMLVDYQDTELPLSNTRIYPIDQSSYRFLENITL
ncbi:MAG: hypothetical protein KDC53_00460, partial [Saprospiraceae bacterium]|nr:hypothetical protein [Saprospiraceae bacterium]